jgi:formylglycine-generating enzyme required for sulfatase activity
MREHRRLAGPGAALLTALVVAACGSAAPAATPSPAVPAASIVASVAPSTEPSAAPSIRPTAVPSDGQSAGQARVDGSGIGQVWVPAGTFRMGTDAASVAALTALGPPAWVASEFASEQPRHEVRLTKGYWIDTFEVTNRAFAAFVDAGGYTNSAYWSDAGRAWLAGIGPARRPLHCQGDVPEHPRMCITWYEAEAYATWRGGRLPTEAEWEFAARGPKSTVYPWGDLFDVDRANVVNSIGPKPVGSYQNGVSWVGAHDMAGNAMEWVSDWLDVAYYETSPRDDPTGPATGTEKVEKGGWWGSNHFVARSAYRHYEDPPTYGDKHIGFRVASR